MDMVSDLLKQQVDFFLDNQSILVTDWQPDTEDYSSYDLSSVDIVSIFLQKKSQNSKQDLAPLFNDDRFLLRHIFLTLKDKNIDFSDTDFEPFLFKCDFFDSLYQAQIFVSHEEAHALVSLSIDFFGLRSIPFYASPLKYNKKTQSVRLDKGIIEFILHSTTQDQQGHYLCYVAALRYEGGGSYSDLKRKISFDSPGGNIVNKINSYIDGCWNFYHEETEEEMEEEWSDQDSWFLGLATRLLTGICIWDSYDDSLVYLTETVKIIALRDYHFESRKSKTLYGDFDDQYGNSCL